jgi:hypothetical protein
MERSLAHIEKIDWIKPIEGADKIELCGVLGWQCVIAKKDNFKVGDTIIYIEVDSVVPEVSQFEFLRDRKFRVRTIKLKGELSQGLVIPVPKDLTKRTIGLDVTDALGITKYMSPSEKEEADREERSRLYERNKLKKFMLRYSWYRRIFLSRKQKEGFPYWVSKTDEERIQNMPRVLEQFADELVYVTEKIDGQSATFTGKMVPQFGGYIGRLLPKKFKFVVCSRNLTTNDKNTLYWKIAERYNIVNILKENPTLTIQGEQNDTKVQGNKYGFREPVFNVFNIIDHEKNYHFNIQEIEEFCFKNGLNVVPVIADGITLSSIGKTVPSVIEMSKGQSKLANIQREGIVVRCVKDGKKILSFKCINPDFLLKYE